MRLLIVDNYDSFTWNLYHILEQYADEVVVVRNDVLDFKEVGLFDGIVLSPGPGLPADAGKMPGLIKTFAGNRPILGICLGLQAIGQAFGAKLKNLQSVYHGVAIDTIIMDKHEPLFTGFPTRFPAGRYHSWVVDSDGLPSCFKVTAIDSNGLIMALRHKEFDICGVQFHPESIMTTLGDKMIENWVRSIE